MDTNGKDVFRQMYKSGLRGTYFKTMMINKDPKKSRVQEIEQIGIEEQEQIDENTFRLNRKFKVKEDHYSVFKKNAWVYNETEGFFSCIASRRKLHLELDNSKLRLMQGDSLIQFFDFNLLSADAVPKGNYFTLNVKNCQRQFYFEPVDKRDSIVEWTDFLNKIIRESDGKVNNYTQLAEDVPNFEKIQSVSNQEFESKANSGDIMLFRSQHSAARAQQLFTNSEYDHVGIILRNAKNEIFVYESTSSEGVGLTPWRHMIKYEWYKSTQKIVWRRLRMELTEIHTDIIEQYVAKTLGKGFQLNIQKLFMFKSKLNRSPEEEKDKTYFCSELLARLYKELGLLNESKASTQYFPVDFSNKGSLKLQIEGVVLEPERLICFDGVKKKR